MVKRRPEAPPEMLARLRHDPAHRRHVAVLCRPPRRSGRQHPVDNASHVEASGHQHGRAREQVRPPSHYEEQRAVRHEEPAPVHRRQDVLPRADLAGPTQSSLKAVRRTGAERQRPVGLNRIVHPHPREQGVRVVVGHVVVGVVDPHLKGVDADVPGGRRRRRWRRSGVATPTATAPHASVRRARELRKAWARIYGRRGWPAWRAAP